MPRYRLTIAYDGTLFHGWQKQEPPDPNWRGDSASRDAGAVTSSAATPEMVDDDSPIAPHPGPLPAQSHGESGPESAAVRPRIEMRTVQGVVERAVREVVRERVILLGASRTDAGVHARGQVAAFTCSDLPKEPEPGYAHEQRAIRTGWPLDRGTEPMLRAINSRLPEDILIVSASQAPPDFDPIGHAASKCYSYTFHVSKHRPLWDRNLVHHLWTPHDVRLMEIAAHHFVGEHDFAGFAAAGHGRLTTVRTVHACRVMRMDAGDDADPEAYRIRMEIEGNGFLYNMVRIIAGTLADVGRGRIEAAQVPWIIKSLDRRRAGPTMPASGLCLEWIRYRGDTA